MSSPQASPVDQPTTRAEGLFADKSSIKQIEDTHTEELVIALCGPIGSPLHAVADRLKTVLEDRFAYGVNEIRLSKFIEDRKGGIPAGILEFERIEKLIKAGNELREECDPAILAELAIAQISTWRTSRKLREGNLRFVGDRTCHIINSIKNQGELDLLRSVYRDLMFTIGVFAPLNYRVDQLKNGNSKVLPKVHTLINEDSGEEIETGQTVRDTFPQSDYFLRVDENSFSKIEDKLQRFLSIILGTAVNTPTADESAMYFAASAARNSACLSRQVGAAITDKNGELLGVGWNDVPKFGGNLYISGSQTADHRCFNWREGKCHNDAEKDELASVISEALKADGVITEDQIPAATRSIRKSNLRDLIEFSRAIHAEMFALIGASRSGGERVRAGKLYCTTYPCHACARHMIAAGISEVYFIEPYVKSKATKLHADAITENEAEVHKVRLLPFDGIAPNRYRELFEANLPRKEGGKVVKRPEKTSSPKLQSSLESLPVLEAIVVNGLRTRSLI